MTDPTRTASSPERGTVKHVLLVGLSAEAADWVADLLPQVRVSAAAETEAGVEALAADGADLVVVDGSLPDAPALIAAQKGVRPVLFCGHPPVDVALARRLVDELGVRQLLFHPLDREEFARQAGAVLGVAVRTSSDREQGDARMRGAVAALWEKFRGTTMERVAVVERAVVARLHGELEEEQRRAAEREAHKLAGSVGTFGYREASRVAREIERILGGSAPIAQAQLLRLSELVVALQAELEGESEAAAEPTDQEPATERPRLLLLEEDPTTARELEQEALLRGFEVRAAAGLREVRDVLPAFHPHVALLDVTMEAALGGGQAMLRALAAWAEPVPVVVLTSAGQLTDRVEAARHGARIFLKKPLPAARVIDEVWHLHQRLRPQRFRVLAVDDDPQSLATLRLLLSREALEVATLADPLAFWTTLEDVSPDLLILDVDMPHLSGVELCRVVRDDPRWKTLPILFLTGNTGPDIVHRVFAAGADDFVQKPIVGPELVTRIHNRLERVRLFREMADTDFLTRIPNRRKALDQIEQLRRLAERHRQPLCLAVLDLDHFKAVNDSFGHAAGDRVLVKVAERLSQVFRGEDVVGRWGGEEFILGMYGMTRRDGMQRLHEVLERFRAEPMEQGEAGELRVAFSGGVAEFPRDGENLGELFRAADAALLRAKAAGRGRFLLAGDGSEEGARGIDVAIVEDDEMIAGLLLHALETRGYTAEWIGDGHLALEQLGGASPSTRPRVLLLDVDLPGVDGISVLRRLMRDGLGRHTRVIMLTARSGELEVLEALQVGAFDHVAKPFSVPVLVERVRRALESGGGAG